MDAEPSRPEDVRWALLAYLGSRLAPADVRFAEEPQAITHGLDTYIYRFRLEASGLGDDWARPLILRIYPSIGEGPRAEREAAVQRFVADRGYSAPRPLAVEAEGEPFHLPFMIMERAPGVPMLKRMANPLAIPRLLSMMADTHVALHRLAADGCPVPSNGPLVDRQLTRLREMNDRFGLQEVGEGLAWLEKRKDAVIAEELSLCHNDFHPLNILVDEDGRPTVIDWTEAALGDRHCDVARTLALFWLAPPLAPTAAERLLLYSLRGFLSRRYSGRYHRLLPIDQRRLRYWEAMNGLWGWAQLLAIQRASPAELGARPEAIQRVPPGLLSAVRRYFWERVSRF